MKIDLTSLSNIERKLFLAKAKAHNQSESDRVIWLIRKDLNASNLP